MIGENQIAGVILAGGKASRMGFLDKALLCAADVPLVEHVIARAAPQVAELVISVNHNREAYRYLHKPLITDIEQQYAGPLVGIYSAMCWLAANRPPHRYTHLACFAGDVPCFPSDTVSRLSHAFSTPGVQLAIGNNGGQLQPLFSLWSLATQPVLATAIAEKLYGPKLIMSRLAAREVTFSTTSATDFLNINTPGDLQLLETLLATGG